VIRRTQDAAEVARMLQGIGGSDVGEHDLAEANNWHAWMWGGGVFVVVEIEPGLSEVHTYVYPSARGVHAIRAARKAIDVERSEGVRLIGRTPIANIPARRFAALCGGVVVGVVDNEEVREWAL
jgi:hypothetical protein